MSNVLVVEDEDDIRQLIVDEIRDAGHEVREAIDGEQALEILRNFKVDVVFCDINMPHMNGMLLKDRVDQERLLGENARFVFVSARASNADIADGLMLGAHQYITKPIDFDRLLALVE